jgi:hypothetical protein
MDGTEFMNHELARRGDRLALPVQRAAPAGELLVRSVSGITPVEVQHKLSRLVDQRRLATAGPIQWDGHQWVSIVKVTFPTYLPEPRKRWSIRRRMVTFATAALLITGAGWLIVKVVMLALPWIVFCCIVGLLTWWGLGQAGHCPGLHCPGCKCKH